MVWLVELARFEDGERRANEFMEDGHDDAHLAMSLGLQTRGEFLEARATAHGRDGGEVELAAQRWCVMTDPGRSTPRGPAFALLWHHPQPGRDRTSVGKVTRDLCGQEASGLFPNPGNALQMVDVGRQSFMGAHVLPQTLFQTSQFRAQPGDAAFEAGP